MIQNNKCYHVGSSTYVKVISIMFEDSTSIKLRYMLICKNSKYCLDFGILTFNKELIAHWKELND